MKSRAHGSATMLSGPIPASLRRIAPSFRNGAAKETGHPREVIEAVLAHVVQHKVEAAYARLFEHWPRS